MTGEGSELTFADVERIVQLVEDGGFGYVRLDSGALQLKLVREGYTGLEEGAPAAAAAPSGASAALTPPPPVAAPAPAAAAVPAAPPPPAEPAAPPVVDARPVAEGTGTVVTSPIIGIFYRAPNPDSPPYVEVGQQIEAGATVGLVEVMKMFTAVKAEVGGRVSEVLAGNGEQVDRGQPLVRIVEE